MLYAGVPLTVLLVLLQVSAASSLQFGGAHPDLLVVWLGCWAVLRNQRELIVLVGTAGCAFGLLGNEPLGASLLALLPIIGLAFAAEPLAERNGLLAALALVFAASVLFALLWPVGSLIGGQHGAALGSVLRLAPRAAALDLVAVLFAYWPMRTAFHRRRGGGQFRRPA